MGFHPAWKYETVIEFIFADGALVQTFDRSERMAEVRARVLAQRDKADREEELWAFVRRSFDRTYRMA